MTTMPPEQPPPTTARPATPWANMPDMARLPIPGNAEFGVYVLALVVAWIVAWATDTLGANEWFVFFTATTVAYLLSRGIAKASRVLEQ